MAQPRKKQPQQFNPPQRIESGYRRSIQNFFMKYLRFNPLNPISETLRMLANLANNTEFLNSYSDLLARRMVTHTRNVNARSWREAAQKAGMGREMYEALNAELQGPVGTRLQLLVKENAQLISNVPTKVSETITREVASLQQKGLRPEAISSYLSRRIPQLAKHRIALIARTEASKAASALTQARSQEFGVDYYIWSTSHDQRVRCSHRLMEGVIVPWSDAPSPEALARQHSTLGHYHAGNAPNCRCTALPLITLSVISFPARFYRHGKIERITLARFRQISGIAA
jgi:SPP1 gp7 family putative phage head morphogenesis protein